MTDDETKKQQIIEKVVDRLNTANVVGLSVVIIDDTGKALVTCFTPSDLVDYIKLLSGHASAGGEISKFVI